jgi:hypothetical protein
MLLYRLQQKQTGKFLCSIKWYNGQPVWNDKGSLFRTMDSMKKHLGYLIGEHLAREKLGFPRCTQFRNSKHYKYSEKWDAGRYSLITVPFKFNLSHLKYYQIVINDVTIKGEKIIQGTEFIECLNKEETNQ